MKQVVLHTMKVWCVHIFGNTYLSFSFKILMWTFIVVCKYLLDHLLVAGRSYTY